MPEVFADTFYWIALLNLTDKWHQDARTFSQDNPEVSIDTTDAVLMEMLNYFSGAGGRMRQAATAMCAQTMAHANTVVLPQPREVFASGLDLYRARLEKAYRLTDCISMVEMRKRNPGDGLTHDRHFAQEGFNLLFR